MTLIKQYRLKKGMVEHHLWEDQGMRNAFKMEIPRGFFLNLGCGTDIRDGFINGDINLFDGLNVLLDLDSPLPFKNNSVDEVQLNQVLAHLKHPRKLMKEIERILKPGYTASVCSCTCDCKHRFNLGSTYIKERAQEAAGRGSP